MFKTGYGLLKQDSLFHRQYILTHVDDSTAIDSHHQELNLHFLPDGEPSSEMLM